MSGFGALGVLFVFIAGQRILELRIAKRNTIWAREHGAVEHGAAHYPLFVVLHTSWLLGWLIEGWLRGPEVASYWWAFFAAFAAAQALRYLAISTLGRRWNTRIFVIPGDAPVSHGIYGRVRHPNYIAVTIELIAVPLLFNAYWTALIATIANAVLLLALRIPAEVAALRSTER